MAETGATQGEEAACWQVGDQMVSGARGSRAMPLTLASFHPVALKIISDADVRQL